MTVAPPTARHHRTGTTAHEGCRPVIRVLSPDSCHFLHRGTGDRFST